MTHPCGTACCLDLKTGVLLCYNNPKLRQFQLSSQRHPERHHVTFSSSDSHRRLSSIVAIKSLGNFRSWWLTNVVHFLPTPFLPPKPVWMRLRYLLASPQLLIIVAQRCYFSHKTETYGH
ncbi:hypothetical protein GALMADRAFT_716748 [Galerina marginata CBS 339.88]|uniref:Uncharacterized protein n=1 Tax=Galerina marginata (strain CBS 339.88) TaxID=685588 RepID=A0A067TQE7_GALM3|nr:hypothetical protein GALMADRAFT_716748 [Galerina marginata CBS 339.88]